MSLSTYSPIGRYVWKVDYDVLDLMVQARIDTLRNINDAEWYYATRIPYNGMDYIDEGVFYDIVNSYITNIDVLEANSAINLIVMYYCPSNHNVSYDEMSIAYSVIPTMLELLRHEFYDLLKPYLADPNSEVIITSVRLANRSVNFLIDVI